MGYSIFDDTMVEMPWPEIERAAAGGAIALLPIGIIEEHGPHIGLAVDTYAPCLVSRLVKQALAARGITTLIAPPQYWGVSPSTGIFPGTFSLRPATMQSVIYDILASLSSWGLKKVFIINWHADVQHCRAICAALQEARGALGTDAVFLLSGGDIRRLRLTGREDFILIQEMPDLINTSEKYADIHAGSMETAVMARYFPEHVNAALAKKLTRTELTFNDLKDLGKSAEITRRLIPDGYFGNPAGYDTGLAEQYIEACVKGAVESIAGYLKK